MNDKTIIFGVIAFLGLFITTVLVWRLLSQRHVLPCPTWLIWTLEHRIMERVAGSRILLDRARVTPGMKVLDAGCGPGRLTIPLAEWVGEGGQVTAMDIQLAMLEVLKARMARHGFTQIRILHAGLGEGALEGDQFDRAFLVTVLGEIPNRSAALQEIKEALRPGGILSVTEVFPDPHFQRRSVVRRLAREAGFIQGEEFGNARAYTLNLLKPEGEQNFAYTRATASEHEG